MALTPEQQAIVDRLKEYNSNPYNKTTNPHGLPYPGYVTEFPRALTDVADIAEVFADQADGVATAKMEWRGAYDAGTAYAARDVVESEGSGWVALQATTGNAPPTLPTTANAYWELIVAKGDKGDTGDAATVAAGTTTTGNPGTSASVSNSGTSAAAVFDFTIPRGDKGDTGDTGPANSLAIGTVQDGAAADATITGTAPSQTLNLTLPKGDKGDTGDAATIAVGTVTTVGPTDPATVTNSGTSGAAVFDFEIPKGDPGDGSGDMLAATYDPTGVAADAFAMANMAEGATAKIFTSSERSKLSGIAAGAQVNVKPDWNAAGGDTAEILNKPTIGTAIGDLVRLVDVSGAPGLPAIDGSQLTGVATELPPVERPHNLAPANGATNLSVDKANVGLSVSPFYSLYGKDHAATQWQLSTSAGFGAIAYDQTVGAVTSHTVPGSSLAIDETYYWRARFQDEDGKWSEWTEVTWFSTADIYVSTPSITSPPNNDTDVGETPTFASSAYNVVNGPENHISTDWEVRLAADDSLIWSSSADTSNKTSITMPSGELVASTQYKVRVRYHDANYGSSAWSSYVTFTTTAQFLPTVIGEPWGGGYYVGRIMDGGQEYALIVAPKASGENASVQWKNADSAGPVETQTLTNGPAATAAMVAAGNASVYPAAHWANNLTIGGHNDWYLPARDELELIWRNFKPVTTSNNTNNRPKSSITYNRDGNSDDQSADTMGVNRHSIPAGAAYTVSEPGQTIVNAFKSGGAEAMAFGSEIYWSSSEYSSTFAWRQNYHSSYPGLQNDINKAGSCRARAVRRLAV